MSRALTGLLVCCTLTAAVARAAVPARYTALYAHLERVLDDQTRLEAAARPGGASPLLCTDLLAANSNRGEALLAPEALRGVRVSLDAFRDLGVGCVKFALQYPLLRPGFPHRDGYLAFYRTVIAEARTRGIKTMPHVSVIFADTPYSPMTGLYEGLTLEQFTREYRDMVMLVARELKPDYLDLLTEPDTHARLTGLRALMQPDAIASVIQNALRGWDHSGTLCGAGSGTWSSTDFARAFAKIPELDFIAIHVYPVSAGFLDNARQMARIARAAGKRAIIDEAWLHKTDGQGVGEGVAASADIFRKNAFSFWEPLDRKFMTLMFELARHEQVAVLSFFWSTLLYGSLEYAPEFDRMSYQEVTSRVNRRAYAAMTAKTPGPLGQHFRSLANSKQ
jgi:hypothetical protein